MKIIFEGDSITDAGKKYGGGCLQEMGQGYALIVNAYLSARDPEKYTFDNVGISGSRIVDVYARIKTDCWNRNPDLISLLIGVNDYWHELAAQNGVDAKRFYNVYKMLVEDSMERFPNLQMILMEPFVLPGSATTEHWAAFDSETKLRAEIVRKIAQETKQSFLPLQEIFDKACEKAPASYWLGDGVHPTPAGHQLIANAWLELFDREIKK